MTRDTLGFEFLNLCLKAGGSNAISEKQWDEAAKNAKTAGEVLSNLMSSVPIGTKMVINNLSNHLDEPLALAKKPGPVGKPSPLRHVQSEGGMKPKVPVPSPTKLPQTQPTTTKPKDTLFQTMPSIPKASMETAKASGSWNGPAMYLTEEAAANGTMFVVYSKTEVKDAIAYAKPSKPIPGFKFNTGGGKTQLVQGTSDRSNFMRGVAAFVKTSKTFLSEIDYKSTHNITIYVHFASNAVEKAVPGTLLSVDGMDAVACMPAANKDIHGISTMDKALFVQRGDAAGGTAS
eukprot:TRINITY_DN21812_c0_g1_i1.p1 TRINITY_DN21812_c0_g1~~TRINITY_DN21812_c0_g1_i1.p1  ORF type:complete len:304 (+),score=56.22 TRINITY_DN21812_c0_g1_i1:43-912(+)